MKLRTLIAITCSLLVLSATAQTPFHPGGLIIARGGPCASAIGPTDDFASYTNFDELDTLNEGCLWSGAYVAHTYENIPAVWLWDPMDDYTDGLILEDTGGGIAWYTFYFLHSYETVLSLRYNDDLTDYTDTDSLISDTLADGLNYWATRVTNQVIPITWNSNYVGHGY